MCNNGITLLLKMTELVSMSSGFHRTKPRHRVPARFPSPTSVIHRYPPPPDGHSAVGEPIKNDGFFCISRLSTRQAAAALTGSARIGNRFLFIMFYPPPPPPSPSLINIVTLFPSRSPIDGPPRRSRCGTLCTRVR